MTTVRDHIYYIIRSQTETVTLEALARRGFPKKSELLLGHPIYIEPTELRVGGIFTTIKSIGVRSGLGLILFVDTSWIMALGRFGYISYLYKEDRFYLCMSKDNHTRLPTPVCTISPYWPDLVREEETV